MGKPVKKVGHAAALVVYDKEIDIIRAEIQRQRQHVGLQSFRLTGSGSSRYQAVRAVVFLMHIQIADISACFHPYLCLHILIVAVLAPPFLRIQLVRTIDMEHLQKGKGIGKISSLFYLLHLNA